MSKEGDFSIYEFEKEGFVSIWFAIVPLSRIPKDYFEEQYGDEDRPFTRFSDDFRFGFFNYDHVDTNASARRAKPIEELVGQCSFSASYVTDVAKKALQRRVKKTQFVFLLYDIAYAPKRTGRTKSTYVEYLGSFPYDEDAPSARPVEM